MKTASKPIIKCLVVLTLGVLMNTSCTDYLNIAPTANITENDIFTTFNKFQGFIEDMYQEVVDPTLASAAKCNWNYGLDELVCTDQSLLSAYFEKGNYWAWAQTNYSAFLGTSTSPTNSAGGKGYFLGGWYGIRNANLAIKNIGLFVNGTQEEKDVILGQAYFFRAYFHFEILRHWGHIAYIDSAYEPSNVINPPQLSYRACSDRIDEDLRKAVSLLPANWDNTVVGQQTSGKNAIRVTKGAAWAYIGLNALYAGSPLMAQDATSPNNPDSTKYDIDKCKVAAEAYNEVLKLAVPAIAGGSGAGGYDLQTWDNYKTNFYTLTGAVPLGKEVVWSYPTTMYKKYNYGDMFIAEMGAWGTYSGPTQNYVENFGMANGLPIFASGSGYNPMDPWKNRDPRFYYNIKLDGDRQIQNTVNLDTYVEFFIGGRHRNSRNSLTGYGYKKFYDILCNKYDNGWTGNFFYDVPKVRLAGVLLEFAEAANEAYGPTGAVPGSNLTAVQAVNIVRARANVPGVDARFLTNIIDFRQIIRQERCVELAFEGHRWDDARRWGVAGTLKYREKYEYKFDKAHTYFNKSLYLTSAFEPKHWWLPFPVAQVALSPELKQNPGW